MRACLGADRVAQVGDEGDRLVAKRCQQLVGRTQRLRPRAAGLADGDVLAHSDGDLGWQLVGELRHQQLWLERTVQLAQRTPASRDPMNAKGRRVGFWHPAVLA